MSIIKNIPLDTTNNIPQSLVGQQQCLRGLKGRRYTTAAEVIGLAKNTYQRSNRGITFTDLLSSNLAFSKRQAQSTLKHYLRMKLLFTSIKRRPQQYYPMCLKSDIMKKILSENIPKGVTGLDDNSSASAVKSLLIDQTLKGIVLPLLPSAPLHIHKMQFRLSIDPERYNEIQLTTNNGNRSKEHVEIIGKFRVTYLFYANGTVMVFTESSNNPFKLENETDLSRLLTFFGQIRDRLVTFLHDEHERIVPDIMEWHLTQCDINKDVGVSDALHFAAPNIQVKHLDHIFRVYIKSMGKDTVCRVEESIYPKDKRAIEVINNVFNSVQDIEKKADTEIASDVNTKKHHCMENDVNDNDSNHHKCSALDIHSSSQQGAKNKEAA